MTPCSLKKSVTKWQMFLVPWVIVFLIILLQFLSTMQISEPLRTTAFISIATFLEVNGRLDLASEFLELIGAQGTAIDLDLQKWNADLIKQSGIRHFLEGRFSMAVDRFEKIDKTAHQDYFLWIYEGMAYQKKGEYEKSLQSIEKAIELRPDNQDAYIVRGHIRFQNNDIAAAESDYQNAIQRAPRLGVVYVDIGEAYRVAGDLERARIYYARAMAVDPWDAYSRLRAGEMLLYIDHDLPGARKLIRDASTMMPHWSQLLELDFKLQRADRSFSSPFLSLTPGNPKNWVHGNMLPCKIYYDFQQENWRGIS